VFHGINSEKAIIIIVSKHKKEASSIEVKLIHDSSSANAAIQYGPIKWRGLTDISTANFYDTNNTTRVFFVEVFLGNSIAIKKQSPSFKNRELWIPATVGFGSIFIALSMVEFLKIWSANSS